MMEWLGWSHFRFTTPSGTVVQINPFTTNPDSPIAASAITKANLIFVADGHPDKQGATVEIAQATGATVFAPGELGTWMVERDRPQVVPFAAPGDKITGGGVVARMVESVHSTGLPQPSATIPYGGIAAGVFLTFENGYTVYFRGFSPRYGGAGALGRNVQAKFDYPAHERPPRSNRYCHAGKASS